MAGTAVTMPVLGLTMEEGTVAEWLKREGDSVRKDEPLLLVEMDKGTVEVPSPEAGVLGRILVQVGETVAVRTPIAEIVPEGSPLPLGEAARSAGEGGASAHTPPSPGSRSSPASPRGRGGRVFASPRARMRARSLGIDLSGLTGRGPNGRIVEADVLSAQAAVAEEPRTRITPVARRLAEDRGVAIDAIHGTGPGGRVTQDDVLRASVPEPTGVEQLTRLRSITAERMAASAQATARVTLFLEADFTEAARFRAQLQPEFERLGVPKLPWDAILAKAAGLALAEHTAVRAQWVDGQGLRRTQHINVGVAVALEPEGLVVPVLLDADTRSLRELARDLMDLADKARAGRLSPDEMRGGSFTITNLGAYRVDGFTPIINPPETGILGVGRIAERPSVVDGKLEVRTLCTLSLSFDHRVVDGAPAAAFLARLAELIERPYALLGI